MALFAWHQNLTGRSTPMLCLDYLPFARRVYGQDDAHWFDPGNLLSTCRQAQQGLKPDVMLFPLQAWVFAWWNAHAGALPNASRPTKTLKQALENPALIGALSEVLQVLGTLNRPDAAVALQLGSVEDWLRWVAPGWDDEALDEGDAEDVCVYLAALAHKLPASAFGSLFLQQDHPIDGDASVAYAPLTNAARHFGWSLVLCAPTGQLHPEGFHLLATPEPDSGQGLWLTPDAWARRAQQPVPSFVVGTLAPDDNPATVLAHLAQLRQARD